MSLRRIGKLLITLMAFNSVVDTFFSWERGNFTVRLFPYAFKSLQVGLMLAVILYFLFQRAIRVRVDPLFWFFILFVGDLGISVFYAQDSVNPTDIARTIFWVAAMFAVYLLRQADCLDEGLLFKVVLFNLSWICLRILAFKILNIWIGAAVMDDEGGFDNNGVVNNLGYSLVWFVPLFLTFESKLRFPVMLTVFFSMVAAFKRGALLGLILGFLTYYFLNRRIPDPRRKSLATDMAKGLLVLGLAGAGFLLFKDHILSRMEDFGGEKSLGSGRGIFYQIVLDHWQSFYGMKKLIGAGFFQVMPMLGLYYENAIPAHSDWLETLYDQGVLGVLILGAIHFLIIFRLVEAARRKADYSPQMAYSYVIFFLASVYSITLYTFDTSWFGVAMGYYLGTGELRKHQEREAVLAEQDGEAGGLSIKPFSARGTA